MVEELSVFHKTNKCKLVHIPQENVLLDFVRCTRSKPNLTGQLSATNMNYEETINSFDHPFFLLKSK